MSEIPFLAHRYDNVSNLLEAVNHSVELIKVSQFELSGHEQIKEEDLTEARAFLVHVISTLIDKKTANPLTMTGELATSLSKESDARVENIRHRSDSMVDEDDLLRISPAFLLHMRKQRKKTLKSHLKRMRKLKSDLEKANPLNEEEMQELDQLCFDLDAEATKIFHHLRKV